MNSFLPPVLPDSAPFTPEQRGWLNGYLAAISGGAISGPSQSSQASPPTEPESESPSTRLPTLTIAWGSQTGNAEALARKAAKSLTAAGAPVTVHDLASYPLAQLPSESILLVITSTYGDGEAPDNAAAFHDFLHSADAPALPNLHFAVFALGDSDYPDFCACGLRLDTRLAALGATRLLPRVDADVEFDEPFSSWIKALPATLPALPQEVVGLRRKSNTPHYVPQFSVPSTNSG